MQMNSKLNSKPYDYRYKLLWLLMKQNLLDDRLKQPNSAVVMACIQLFIHLTRGMKDIAEDVYKRIKGSY